MSGPSYNSKDKGAAELFKEFSRHAKGLGLAAEKIADHFEKAESGSVGNDPPEQNGD